MEDDARSMATSGEDTARVGYNVQAVVDAQRHRVTVKKNRSAAMAALIDQGLTCWSAIAVIPLRA